MNPYRVASPTVIPNLNGIKPLVQAGDCYQLVYDMSTRAGHFLLKGSCLYVIESTREVPFGEISESGLNWRCMTQNSAPCSNGSYFTSIGISVWATLEQCLSRGLLVRVERINEPRMQS